MRAFECAGDSNVKDFFKVAFIYSSDRRLSRRFLPPFFLSSRHTTLCDWRSSFRLFIVVAPSSLADLDFTGTWKLGNS